MGTYSAELLEGEVRTTLYDLLGVGVCFGLIILTSIVFH